MSQFSTQQSINSKESSSYENSVSFIRKLVFMFHKEDGNSLSTIFGKSIVEELLNVDLSQILTEFPKEIKPILDAFIILNKTMIITNDQTVLFPKYLSLLQAWNKYAEGLKNWVMAPLAVVAERLVKCAEAADHKIVIETTTNNGIEEENCLTKTGRILDVSKRLCLTDRIEDESVSKRIYIYYFAGLQLKIYYKLRNTPLAKNLEKVLSAKSKELPQLKSIPKAHAIQYLYYSGVVKVGEGDYNIAYEKFQLAYQLCHQQQQQQQQKILIYLIPLTFITKRKLPKQTTLESNPLIKILYSDLINSLKTGNLYQFNRFFNSFEIFFLKRNLYIAIESLRSAVLLRLIKSTYFINNSSPHLNINLISKAIEFSTYIGTIKKKINNNEETECFIANLIFQGKIRGFISHGNEILVLSKKEPFPF